MTKISIRLRITLLFVLLLTICCVGLTVILNFSAYKMAAIIEAVPVTPAVTVKESGVILPPDVQIPASGSDSIYVIPMENVSITDEAKSDFFLKGIIAMIIVIVGGGVLTYIILGRALKPLSKLSAQMKNRTANNLLEQLPTPQSNDEIALLTVSFNEMSQKLGQAFAVQKRFSESAAHELRTPLSIVKTKIQVFQKKKDRTKEEYDTLINTVLGSTNRLSGLVGELLELTNMEDDTILASMNETVELRSLLQNITEELLPLCAAKNIGLTLLGEPFEVVGSSNLLYRAFFNLVENAIKYNTDNGSVSVVLKASDGSVKVTITDTCKPIPAALYETIFEPFFRVEKSRSKEYGGVGLGLPLVKSIIQKHGGSVSVEPSKASGNAFTVTL